MKSWKQFADEKGGIYIAGEAWHSDRVEVPCGQWKLIFDIHTFYTTAGQVSIQKTISRVRVPFQSRQEFKFLLYRENLWTNFSKLFGAQDIRLGDASFDKNFMIKGDRIAEIQTILSAPKIKELIHSQEDIRLEIADCEGYYGEKLPENRYELFLMTNHVIKDMEEMNALYDLMRKFMELLSQYSKMTV